MSYFYATLRVVTRITWVSRLGRTWSSYHPSAEALFSTVDEEITRRDNLRLAAEIV